MQNPPEQNTTEFLLKAGQYLLIPLLLALGAGIKWAVDKWTASRNNAFDQLTKLLEVFQTQLAKKEISDEAKDIEIKQLNSRIDEILIKTKQARYDLVDLRLCLKQIRNFLDENKINDESILSVIAELETKLKEISDNLKSENKPISDK